MLLGGGALGARAAASTWRRTRAASQRQCAIGTAARGSRGSLPLSLGGAARDGLVCTIAVAAVRHRGFGRVRLPLPGVSPARCEAGCVSLTSSCVERRLPLPRCHRCPPLAPRYGVARCRLGHRKGKDSYICVTGCAETEKSTRPAGPVSPGGTSSREVLPPFLEDRVAASGLRSNQSSRKAPGIHASLDPSFPAQANDAHHLRPALQSLIPTVMPATAVLKTHSLTAYSSTSALSSRGTKTAALATAAAK